MIRRPPSSPLPPIVQLLMFVARPVHFVETYRRRYGDIFLIRSPIFGNEVVVTRVDTVRQVFRGDPDVYRAGEANAALSALVGSRSVLLLDGAPHRRQRSLLMPPFHGDRMRSYTDTMREQTLRVIDRWPTDTAFSLQPHMQRITLEVILRTVFGMDEDEQLRELRDTLDALLVYPTSPIGLLPMVPALQRDLGPLWPYGKFMRQLAATDAMIHRQIERARARLDADRTDILSLLLGAVDENGDPMSDAELRDELMTLLVAGHETTATALCWVFEQILLRDDVRARVERELDDVVGDEAVRAAHVPQLKVLEAAIMETLRLRPIIPFFGRKLSAPAHVQGYDLPAGDMVVPCPWLLHRDPEHYPDPERFDLDRFIGKKPDPYAWAPFGGGTRRCIGMAFAFHEMKIVLATALTQRTLRLARAEPARVVLRGFVFSPKGGTRVVAARHLRSARISRTPASAHT